MKIFMTHEVYMLTVASIAGILLAYLDYSKKQAFVMCVCFGIIAETVWGLF